MEKLSNVINSDMNIIEQIIEQSNKILSGNNLYVEPYTIESQLTQLLFINRRNNNEYEEIYKKNPLQLLDLMKGGRQVCQYPFRKNDIVWICRTCQRDETCVICNNCYSNSDHNGHEVFFYHSQAGGCCDCGDGDAWCPKGFCNKHGHVLADPEASVPNDLHSVALKLLDNLAEKIAVYCETYASCYKEPTINPLLVEIDMNSSNIYFIVIHYSDIIQQTKLKEKLIKCGLSPEQCKEISQMSIQQGSYFISQENKDKAEIIELMMKLNKQMIRYSLVTQEIKQSGENILMAISFLYTLAQTTDGMCRMICKSLTIERVTRMLKNDLRICKKTSAALHNLFLTLMADQSFKMILAISYTNAYRFFSDDFRHGVGCAENSIFTLSVQFLNREAFVSEIVNNHNFLGHVSYALETSLTSALTDVSGFVSNFKNSDMTDNAIFLFRRYVLFIGDLKIAFTIPGMSRTFMSVCLSSWLRILSHFQYMHPQVRHVDTHIEHENTDWVHAFNLYLALVSLFEYLFNWLATPDSIEEDGETIDYFENPEFYDLLSEEYTAKYGDIFDDETAEVSLSLCNASSLIRNILYAIFLWQDKFTLTYTNVRSKFIGDFTVRDPLFYGKHSFHLFLHRFFASAILECCKYHHHSKMLLNLVEFLSHCEENQLSLLIDAPLRNFILAAQIRNKHWIRNGQTMLEQMLNYSEAPFCKVFKDLDLLILQFCSLSYGVEKLVNHIMYRFNCLQYADANDSVLRKAIDISQTQNDIDELLQLLILITVDLPIKPFHDPADRALLLMRREAIHHLACSPSSYSTLHEALAVVPDNNKVKVEDIDKMINEIAELRRGSGLDPPKLYLKKESWQFYDPTYPHCSSRNHQEIIESRPKITSIEPMVCRPLESHPAFASLRIQMTSNHTLLCFMRELVLIYAAHRLDRSSNLLRGYDIIRKNWSLKCNSAIFSRILHMMTLVIHELDSVDRNADALSAFVSVLLEPRLLKYEQIVPISDNEDEDEPLFDLQTITFEGPTLLCALIDVYETLSSNEEINHRFWLEWILKNISQLDKSCDEHISQRMSVRKDEQKKKEMELKRKKAVERSLKMMKKSTASFQAHLEKTGQADDDLEINQDNYDTDYDEFTMGNRHDVPICIICQLSNDDTLYYQAFNQSSTILRSRCMNLHLDCDEKNAEVDNRLDLHVSFCGHAIHSICFDSYFASTVSRTDYFKNILDIDRGQFCCAFCKKLNNCLVPYIPKNSNQDSKSEKKNLQNVDQFDWLHWIQNPNFEINLGGISESLLQDREAADMSTDIYSESVKLENNSVRTVVNEMSPPCSPSKTSSPPVQNRIVSLITSMKSLIQRKWSSPENQNSLGSNISRQENSSNESRIPVTDEMEVESIDLGNDHNEDKKILCLRFLREMCETINVKLKMNVKDLDYSNHEDGYYSDQIVRSADCCLSSMGFSISMDYIENSEKLKKFDNKKYLDKVMFAIGESMNVFNIFNPVLDDICNAFRGTKVEQSKKRYESQNNKLLLVSTPLLSRPIFDTVILCITIIMFKQNKTDTPIKGINIIICIY